MEESKVSLLEIDALTVEYRTDDAIVHAVNDLDLRLDKGETRGLVGETGAGKTTLALSVLRLLPERVGHIAGGSIRYEGRELLQMPEAEMLALRGKRISMIFQDPMTSLNPTHTVGDQILEVLNLHFPEMTKQQKEAKVDEMMTLVGIPPSRKTDFPHQFSGGMKQRIVIAMALVAEPELLLADEPTTALDVTIQAQILELIRNLKNQFHTAVLLITHDLGVVAEFCDTVSVVYAGRVVEYGTVEAVFEKKNNHPYTAGLFGCIPDLKDDQPRLHPIAGRMSDPRVVHEGCCFCDRCDHAMERCKTVAPAMHVHKGHGIACHLFENREDF
ncbi:MAG: ABC transporter ATP-binding protein [Lachnospiraceae bacterium]|nr:ABC transporter ATP-binding protein [Lachnospiraceae bacterium]